MSGRSALCTTVTLSAQAFRRSAAASASSASIFRRGALATASGSASATSTLDAPGTQALVGNDPKTSAAALGNSSCACACAARIKASAARRSAASVAAPRESGLTCAASSISAPRRTASALRAVCDDAGTPPSMAPSRRGWSAAGAGARGGAGGGANGRGGNRDAPGSVNGGDVGGGGGENDPTCSRVRSAPRVCASVCEPFTPARSRTDRSAGGGGARTPVTSLALPAFFLGEAARRAEGDPSPSARRESTAGDPGAEPPPAFPPASPPAGLGDAARVTSSASISAFKSTLGGGLLTAQPDQEGRAGATFSGSPPGSVSARAGAVSGSFFAARTIGIAGALSRGESAL